MFGHFAFLLHYVVTGDAELHELWLNKHTGMQQIWKGQLLASRWEEVLQLCFSKHMPGDGLELFQW